MNTMMDHAEELNIIVHHIRRGDITTLSDLSKAIIQLAERYYAGDEDGVRKTKGNLWEVTTFIFLKTFESSPRVGLVNYKPIGSGDDYGVDGVGVNASGVKSAVQSKFRSNPTDLIPWDDLGKFDSCAWRLEGVDVAKPNSLWLFTNAAGASHVCEKVLSSSLKVINGRAISKQINNNSSFWASFNRMVSETLTVNATVVAKEEK